MILESDGQRSQGEDRWVQVREAGDGGTPGLPEPPGGASEEGPRAPKGAQRGG